MPTFKNIVCPVDFSESSHHALKVAIELAASAGATLTIAHVWQATYGTAEYPIAPTVLQAVVDEAEQLLATLGLQAKKAGVGTVKTTLLTGSPWAELIRLLEEDRSYDLVVMGTHGRTGLKHILIGSVAEKVVRHAPCAVLIIR